MRTRCALLALLLCAPLVAAEPSAPGIQPPAPAPSAAVPEKLAVDTPSTTVLGNSFIAPAEWSLSVQGPATILAAPEGDPWIALVDVTRPAADGCGAGCSACR